MSYFDRAPIGEELGGFLLFSRSAHKHVTLTWSSGQAPPALLPTLQCRLRFSEPLFGRLQGVWHYCFPRRAPSGAEGTLVCVWGATFSPEMMLTLAKAISDAYASSGGSTLAAQAAWQSALCEGCIGESWVYAKFDASKNFRTTGAKLLLAGLGVEVILVWAALMLRKRVALLGSSASEVIKAVRLLPLLVAHRFPPEGVAAGTAPTLSSPASLMHPYVALGDAALVQGGEENEVDLSFGPLGAATKAAVAEGTAAQLAELQECGSWVAGFVDAGVASRGGELWDVCVDLRARTVTVADAAKGELALGSIHKEVAKALVGTLEDAGTSDNAVLAVLSQKSGELVQRLSLLFPDGLPVGVPAGALPMQFTAALPYIGVVGDTSSAALRAGFRDTLAKNGLAASVGVASAEGFMWGVCAAEPALRYKY